MRHEEWEIEEAEKWVDMEQCLITDLQEQYAFSPNEELLEQIVFTSHKIKTFTEDMDRMKLENMNDC